MRNAPAPPSSDFATNQVNPMSVPVKIVIVYHSGYSHTEKIAEAVARGAGAIIGASVELVTAEEAPSRWELFDDADAIVMGAPTYMGSLSAPFKAFMDATSHLQYAEKRWQGKVAAGFNQWRVPRWRTSRTRWSS
jgi:NAD(P)H dehydrogenase (quinone)